MPRLPTTDLTSDAIKAFLGITGEVTLDDICKSDRVRGEYFDVNYLHDMALAYYSLLSGLAGYPLGPAGIREGVRLVPQDISNFRNYGFDSTGYSILAFSGEHNDNKILKYNNDEYWNDFYSAPIRDMRTAVRAPDGLLWVGGQVSIFLYTNERGLFSFNGSTWTRYTTPQITGEYVYAIEQHLHSHITILVLVLCLQENFHLMLLTALHIIQMMKACGLGLQMVLSI
jgi:hypothetical protein